MKSVLDFLECLGEQIRQSMDKGDDVLACLGVMALCAGLITLVCVFVFGMMRILGIGIE